jgi:nitrous oxide reductase accessory protein NosL
MKKSYLITAILLTAFLVQSQEKPPVINECSQCETTIDGTKFNAMAIENNGHVHEFDAIECLAIYLNKNDISAFEKIYVADYSTELEMIEARKAVYLKSKKINSPGGGNLAAFETYDVAKKAQKELGGKLFVWGELIKKFSNPKYEKIKHLNI